MHATLKDIAERANVSQAAVSLAINGKRGVGRETAERILRIAGEMGYQISAGPQTAPGSFKFVQLRQINPLVDPSYSSFISEYLAGMTEAAHAAGRYLEMYPVPVDATAADVIHQLQDQPGTSGAVILGAGLYEEDLRAYEQCTVPVAFVDVSFAYVNVNMIDMNNADSVYRIVSHLRDSGHVHIGLVQGRDQTPNFQKREDSFRTVVKQLGMKFGASDYVKVRTAVDEGAEDLRAFMRSYTGRLAEERPTALFCINDIVAYACIKACREHEIAVPDDLSVIGFDDLPASSMTDPPLTTFSVSKRLIGIRAVELLISQLHNGTIHHTETILINGELVLRKSVKQRFS
jgi:DNA-binding LacI/PurR family transcriptional regulator